MSDPTISAWSRENDLLFQLREENKRLREALAEQPTQPQQEPVAGCVCRWNSEGDRVVTCERHQGWLEVIAEWADRAREAEKKLKVLNTSPPAQEIVCSTGLRHYRKPLTESEAETLFDNCGGRWIGDHWVIKDADLHDFARAIEAAHNIKENT